MKELIQEAAQMLLDRPPQERQLIVHIAKMPDDLRAAIVLASQCIDDDVKEEA